MFLFFIRYTVHSSLNCSKEIVVDIFFFQDFILLILCRLGREIKSWVVFDCCAVETRKPQAFKPEASVYEQTQPEGQGKLHSKYIDILNRVKLFFETLSLVD